MDAVKDNIDSLEFPEEAVRIEQEGFIRGVQTITPPSPPFSGMALAFRGLGAGSGGAGLTVVT